MAVNEELKVENTLMEQTFVLATRTITRCFQILRL